MTFSVIMPLYNKAPYVEKAIRSVLEQTYPHYELIVINDGSTDNSAEIAEKLLEGVTNTKFINQQNLGVATTRNNGVVIAKGQYVCFLDADDWWDVSFLQEMSQFIKEYPEAGIWGTNYWYVKRGMTRVGVRSETGYINYPFVYKSQTSMPLWTGAVSMSKVTFLKYGGFPVGIKLGEDFLLWTKIALAHKVAFLNKTVSYYNNDVPATMRATRNLHKPEQHMLFMMSELEEAVANNNISNKEDWSALLDWLRVNGLLEYWLCDEYRERAKHELAKVDWSKQPSSIKKIYAKPIWFLRAKRSLFTMLSFIKQKLIAIFAK
jgi:glycosyltransferase involved in cell wall biosynthesis